jgi:hypothetical protein
LIGFFAGGLEEGCELSSFILFDGFSKLLLGKAEVRILVSSLGFGCSYKFFHMFVRFVPVSWDWDSLRAATVELYVFVKDGLYLFDRWF